MINSENLQLVQHFIDSRGFGISKEEIVQFIKDKEIEDCDLISIVTTYELADQIFRVKRTEALKKMYNIGNNQERINDNV